MESDHAVLREERKENAMEQRPKMILTTDGFPYMEEGDYPFVRMEFFTLCMQFDVTVINIRPSHRPTVALPDGVRHLDFTQKMSLFRALSCLFRRTFWREYGKARVGVPLKTRLLRGKGILSREEKTAQFQKFLTQNCLQSGMVGVYYTFWDWYTTLAFARVRDDYPGMRLVTRAHGCDYHTERTAHIGNWQPHLMEIDRALDRLYFVSEIGRAYYYNRYGVVPDGNKYRVSFLGTEKSEARITERTDRFVIVSCCRAIPLKRIHFIIQALACMPDDINVSWHQIGGGPDLETLKALAQDLLGAKPNIHYTFCGEMPNADVKPYYIAHGAAVFVHTSAIEGGLPVAIQEAFSVGLPAIATPVGGIPEIVRDGETGMLLTETPTPREIADKLTAYWRLPAQDRRAMSDAAYRLWQEKLDATKNAETFTAELAAMV